jgi:hypothetical protein
MLLRLDVGGGFPVPYLRLYSPDITLDQKRVAAQKLIEITLRTFHLRPAERNRITIQFISQPPARGVHGLYPAIPRRADFTLEVIGHDLTEEKKSAFAEEASAMLAHLGSGKPRSRIARLLGIKADRTRQIALQFNELSPAISDPFVGDPECRVA